MRSLKQLKPGDIVILKKPHPCGSNQWMLLKIGIKMELKCIKCGRKIVLDRKEFERRYKSKFE